MFLWHRVISVTSPWVAAENPSYGKVKSFEDPMFSECFKRILRTGRSESACSRSQRGDAALIEAYQGYEREYQNLSEDRQDFIRTLFHFSSVLPGFHSAC